MTAILQIIFDAISLGSLYALGALGIALIFGVMRLVNFAHADYISFCVFAMLWPSIDAAAVVFIGNLPTIILIPVILAIGAGLSVLSEIVVFRRFRYASPATMMIASFALGFIIKYFLLMLYSSRPKSVDLWSDLSQQVEIAGARIPLLQIVTVAITIGVLLGLTAFLKRTRFGLEMRAAAENFTMARMLGVKANRVIMLAFAISGMLAAMIGLILVTQTGTVDIQMGMSLMLVAFIATVIGGLGSLPGAVIAGFLIGGASVLMQVILPIDARPFRDAFVYGAVIICLLWRPQGLFAPKSAKQRV
ncbi:MAG: branched-chain amino acid ABC transporter permease [Parvibaculaceae bacterium]